MKQKSELILSAKLCNRMKGSSQCKRMKRNGRCPAKNGNCVSGLSFFDVNTHFLNSKGLSSYRSKLKML